jgi:hypothetical protein
MSAAVMFEAPIQKKVEDLKVRDIVVFGHGRGERPLVVTEVTPGMWNDRFNISDPISTRRIRAKDKTQKHIFVGLQGSTEMQAMAQRPGTLVTVVGQEPFDPEYWDE